MQQDDSESMSGGDSSSEKGLSITVTHHPVKVSNPVMVTNPVTHETKRLYVPDPKVTWEQVEKLPLRQKYELYGKVRAKRDRVMIRIGILENKLARLDKYRIERSKIYKEMADPKTRKGSPKWNQLWERSKKLTAVLSALDDVRIEIQQFKKKYDRLVENLDVVNRNILRNT